MGASVIGDNTVASFSKIFSDCPRLLNDVVTGELQYR